MRGISEENSRMKWSNFSLIRGTWGTIGHTPIQTGGPRTSKEGWARGTRGGIEGITAVKHHLTARFRGETPLWSDYPWIYGSVR